MGIMDKLLGGGKQSTTQNTNSTSTQNAVTNSDIWNTLNGTQNTYNQGLFGGINVGTNTSKGSSNTGTSSNTSFNQTAWSPVTSRVEKNLLPLIDTFGSKYGRGEGLYSGTRLGAEDALVGQGQDELIRAAGTYGDRSDNLNNTLQGFLNYDPNSYQNTASRDALAANIRAQFNETIRPGIEDQGTFSGQFGGNQKSIALGAASAPLSRAMADAEVNLMNSDRDRAMQAMGMAPTIMGTGFTEGAMLQNVGEQRSAREQLALNDRIQQFEAPRNNRMRSILELQGLLTPLAALGSSGTSRTTGSSSTVYENSGTSSNTSTGYQNQNSQQVSQQIGHQQGNTATNATGTTTGTTAGSSKGGGGGLLQGVMGIGSMFAGGGGLGSLFGGGGSTMVPGSEVGGVNDVFGMGDMGSWL